MASVSKVKSLLVDTTLPQSVIDDSLQQASALWLMSAPASLLAADLVLCHPRVGATEVRAIAHRIDDAGVRLTVVAHDRPGLLADTAGLLAGEGLSVAAASAMSWTASGLALHALTIADCPLTEAGWRDLGSRLRQLSAAVERPVVSFTPIGRAVVQSSPATMGRSVVTVTAPDQVGLLWAICRWFADNGVSIEAASAGAVDGQVEDHFVVVGHPDVAALAARLSESHLSLVTAAGSAFSWAAGSVRILTRRRPDG